MHFEGLDIDEQILDKIESRHGVTVAEVLDACSAERTHVRRGRDGLYRLYGRTDAGRFLLIVLVSLGGGVWKVATARGMTEQERRLYQRSMGE